MENIVKRIALNREFTAEFELHPIYHPNGIDYDVSVTDMQGQPWHFRMKKDRYGNWKVLNAPQVPDWILDIEPELQKAVEDTPQR